MEQQLPEQSAAGEKNENIAAQIFDEQNTESAAEKPTGETENKAEQIVTDRQAIIKIEGQEVELEAALAQDDKLLITVLKPHFAAVENANITREIKNGKLAVTIVKRAQHKGFERQATQETLAPFEILCNEPERINPAIVLADELMRREGGGFEFDDFDKIAAVVAESRAEIGRIEGHFAALVKTPGAGCGAVVPVGF